MKELILYLLDKFSGNWDLIYSAIQSKQTIDWNKLENYKNETINFMSITDDNYCDKLKTIYMPPFGLFYNGDINLINNNVLSILGSLNHNEINNIIKIASDNITLCISNNDINEYLYQKIIEKNIKLIVICEKNINDFKFKKNSYNNILLVSEYNNDNYDKAAEQTVERLLYALANKIFLKSINKQRLYFIFSNYENIKKDFYCLEKYKNNDNINCFYDKNQLYFIKKIEEINFLHKS